VKGSLAELRAQGKVRKLWSRDASLWTGKDEAQWLGWLGITSSQLAHIERLTRITDVAGERRRSIFLGAYSHATGSAAVASDDRMLSE
jgi:hypothetical protein